MLTTFGRVAAAQRHAKAVKQALNDRACVDCQHYCSEHYDGERDEAGWDDGCGLLRNAITGRLGDVTALRAPGGRCGEGGAFYEPAGVAAFSTRTCSQCAAHVAAQGDHVCLKFLEPSTSEIRPQRCAVLRGVDGECGPDGDGWEALYDNAMSWDDFVAIRREQPGITFDRGRMLFARRNPARR